MKRMSISQPQHGVLKKGKVQKKKGTKCQSGPAPRDSLPISKKEKCHLSFPNDDLSPSDPS